MYLPRFDCTSTSSFSFLFFTVFHLQDYLNGGGKWLHVDMAGPAFAEDRATGYGVALLSQLTQRLN